MNLPAGRWRRFAASTLRTIRLIIVSLAIGGVAFAVYLSTVEPLPQEQAAAQVPSEHRDWLAAPRPDATAAQDGLIIDGVLVRSNERTGFTILDKRSLSRKMHIKGRWSQADDSGKRFRLESPTITYYLPNGQKAEIRADEGMISSREADSLDPQKGLLSGNVRIVFDQTTDRWRQEHPELAESPTPLSRLLRVWLERVEFDLDLGWLKSDRAIRIESEPMQLTGVGLEVNWNESTNTFEALEITEGQMLRFRGGKQLGVDLGAISDDGEQSPTSEQNADTVAEQDTPTPQVAEPQEPIGPLWVETDEAIIIDRRVLKQQEKREILTYVAHFDSDVVARQLAGNREEGRLQAAELQVLFDIATGASSDALGAEQSTGDSSSEQTEDSKASDTSTQHVELTWSGPLKITAGTPLEDLDSSLRRHIVATGQPVQLSNPDGRYTCSQLIHHAESDFTEFHGDEHAPALLASDSGSRIEASELISLNRQNKIAELRGDVLISNEDFNLRGQVIDAHFKAPGAEAQGGSLLDLLDVLECRDGVYLRSADDEVSCGFLRVQMARDEEGRNLPRTAHATQDVVARQGTRVLSASNYMDMVFGTLPRDEHGRVLRESPTLRTLIADENVRIVDDVRSWDIAGQRLNCEFDEQQVLTRGIVEGGVEQASVQMGEYYIEGASVTFDETRKWAFVPGEGRARLAVYEDLDGRKTENPVPLNITWTKQMELKGIEDVMLFDGSVQATSENNALSADRLRIHLTDEVPDRQTARVASPTLSDMWFLKPYRTEAQKASRLLGAGRREPNPYLRRFAKRATDIVADGQARLESATYSQADARLESRLTLRGPQITFNLGNKVMFVNGAGLLLIEDYPDREQIASRAAQRDSGLFGSARSSGPSQTFIGWDSSMRYFYKERAASFTSVKEPVSLRHVSGSKILLSNSLSAETFLTNEQLAEMAEAGMERVATMSCEDLIVQFRAAPQGRMGGGQMSMGKLDRFQADGNIVLVDSRQNWRVRGDRLIYIDESQLINLMGLPGEPAYVSGYERDSGRVREWTGPELYIEMGNGTVYAPEGRGRTSGR